MGRVQKNSTQVECKKINVGIIFLNQGKRYGIEP